MSIITGAHIAPINASPVRMPDDPTVVGDPDGSPFDEAFIALLRGGDR